MEYFIHHAELTEIKVILIFQLLHHLAVPRKATAFSMRQYKKILPLTTIITHDF